jgi:hypothetical protein
MSRLFYKNNVLFELYVKLKLRSTDADKKFVLPLLVYPPPPSHTKFELQSIE